MRPTRLLPVPVFAGCLLGLERVGGDDLGVPFGSVDDLTAWVDATEPVALAMAVLRLVAQLLCGYLLLAAVLQLSADALGYPWLRVLARRAVPFAVRHALSGGAGLGLAAGSVLGSAGGVAGASPGPAGVLVTTTDDAAPSTTPTATMTLLVPTPPAGTPATAPAPRGTPTPTATMVLLPPARAGETGTPPIDDAAGPAVDLEPAPVPVADTDDDTSSDGSAPASTLPPPTSLVVTVPSPEAPSTSAAGLPTTTTSAPAGAEPSAVTVDDNEVWVVDAGDSFWSIAEDVVGLGSRTEAYWEQLIAANRGRLAVPDQPDLLFPGQRLTLPPPVPRAG